MLHCMYWDLLTHTWYYYSKDTVLFCSCLLQALLPKECSNDDVAMMSLLMISPTYVDICASLANAGHGQGHATLLRYAICWLDAGVKILSVDDCSNKIHSESEVRSLLLRTYWSMMKTSATFATLSIGQWRRCPAAWLRWSLSLIEITKRFLK